MIHVIPEFDHIEHQEESCACKPRVEIRFDGEMVCIHQAQDGRDMPKDVNDFVWDEELLEADNIYIPSDTTGGKTYTLFSLN